MSLRSEKEATKAVAKVNDKFNKKLDKLKRFGRHALLATVSAVSMLGSMPSMQAQNPQVKEVPLEQLDAHLKELQRKQQYAQVYANRDAYRQQPATQAYHSNLEPTQYRTAPLGQWAIMSLEESHYAVGGNFYEILNRNEYIIESDGRGHYRATERFGDHHSTNLSADDLKNMYEHPGGDTLGITCNPYGPDINNPENNPSWRYPSGSYSAPSKAQEVIRTVDDAARTINGIVRMINGRRGHRR